MIKKIVFGVFLFLALVSVFLYFYPKIVSLFAKDIPPVDISDLKLKEPDYIPEDKNIYFFLKKIAKTNPGIEKIDHLYDYDTVFITEKEKAEAEKELSEYSKVIEYFMNISDLSGYQKPDLQKEIEAAFDTYIKKNVMELRQFRSILQLNENYAKYLASQGKIDEGLEILLKNIRVSSVILDSKLSLIEYFVFETIKKRNLAAFIELSRKAIWSIEKMKKFDPVFSSIKDEIVKKNLANALKLEFLIGISSLNLMLTESADEESLINDSTVAKLFIRARSFYFQPNKTKKLYLDFFNNKISETNIDCQSETNTLPSTENDQPSFISMYFTQNLIGQKLFENASYFTDQRLNSIKKNACKTLYLSRASETLIAILVYKNDYGELPETLNELVPEYFLKIPLDPYSGQPLKYSASEASLTSSGTQAEDSSINIIKNDL